MTRVALISDTHMRHAGLEVPRADLVVCCGDFTKRGTRTETVDFLRWLGALDVGERVMCAGNHDFFAEREPESMRTLAAEAGITYLSDEGAEIAGLRLWASPVTPAFRSMAFNRARGARIRRVWEQIPTALDLLITHGPPAGLGDRTFFGAHVGCADLRDVVVERAPRVHVFGHIHEDAGEHRAPEAPQTRFLNVATSRLLLGTREVLTIEL